MPENAEFNLRATVDVVRRSRRLLILFVVSAMLSSLLLTYVFSEKYRAGTSIMYRPTKPVQIQPDLALRDETSFGFPVPSSPFAALGETLRHIIINERILRTVVADLGLDQPVMVERTGWRRIYHATKQWAKDFAYDTLDVVQYGRIIPRDPTTQAILRLAKSITVDASEDYTARIFVVDSNPERASVIVDRIADELVAFVRERSVQSAQRQREELERRLVAKKEELDAIRARIESMKSAGGFIALDEETTLHLQTAEQIERDLLRNEQALSDAKSRLAVLVPRRRTLAPMLKASETVEDDPLYQTLRAQKSDYEVQLRGLLERLPEHHAEVISLRAQLDMTAQLLDDLDSRRVSRVTTQQNELYQKILADEIRIGAEIQGLASARTSLLEIRDRVRARVADPAVESELDDLQLQLRVLGSDYTQLAAAYEEARTAELTTMVEIQVLHRSTPRDTPFRPIKIYHVGLSALLAGLIGLGVIFLSDYVRSLWTESAPPATTARRRPAVPVREPVDVEILGPRTAETTPEPKGEGREGAEEDRHA